MIGYHSGTSYGDWKIYKIVSRFAKTNLGMETQNCDYVTGLSITNHVYMFLGYDTEIEGIRKVLGLLWYHRELMTSTISTIMGRHTGIPMQHFCHYMLVDSSQ